MKAATDCRKCREKIYKEAETAYLKKEYQFFEDAAYSMAVFATIAAMSVNLRRGRSRTYIRKFFQELHIESEKEFVKGTQKGAKNV